jgi:hypothetical protein
MVNETRSKGKSNSPAGQLAASRKKEQMQKTDKTENEKKKNQAAERWFWGLGNQELAYRSPARREQQSKENATSLGRGNLPKREGVSGVCGEGTT